MNLNTCYFVCLMLKKKNIYHVIIGLSLLLFTQVLIPLLHNHHADRKIEQGINQQSAETCIVCSLDIIPADFILPEVFTVVFVIILFTSIQIARTSLEVLVSTESVSRGPPAYFL